MQVHVDHVPGLFLSSDASFSFRKRTDLGSDGAFDVELETDIRDPEPSVPEEELA